MIRRRPAVGAGVAMLTLAQKIELLIGPGPVLQGAHPSAFASAAHRTAAWFLHRATLLARPGQDGCRPWAFWQFEASEEQDDGAEAAQLIRLGVVDAAELAAIHTLWRRRLAGIATTTRACYGATARGRVRYWADRRGAGIPDDFAPAPEFMPPTRDEDDGEDEDE